MSSQLLLSKLLVGDIFGQEEQYHIDGAPVNCLDGNTYTAWKPNSLNEWGLIYFDTGTAFINCFLALSGVKNVNDLAEIYLSGSLDPEFLDVERLATITQEDILNGIYIDSVENTTPYRYFRVTIANVSAPVTEIEISNILIGSTLDLPNGVAAPYTPPKLSTKSEVTNNKTMGGHFVGRSVLTGQYDFIIKNKNLTPEWINANWQGIHDQILTKPFMYLWDDSKPEDAVFCWTKGDIPAPKYDNQCYFSFSIPCNGFIENV